MIAGLVGVREVDGVDWHLADIADWPLAAYCGEPAPEPMSRQVRPARMLAVREVCPACIDVWGRLDGRPLAAAV